MIAIRSLCLTTDPPGNMTVSKTAIHVSEGNIPEKVFCHAEGRPQPTFEWRYVGNANSWTVPGNSSQSIQSSSQQKLLSSVSNGGNGGVGGGSGSGNSQINNQQLVLNSAVSRQQAGYYACVARNTHGNGTAYTYLDVMCEYPWGDLKKSALRARIIKLIFYYIYAKIIFDLIGNTETV